MDAMVRGPGREHAPPGLADAPRLGAGAFRPDARGSASPFRQPSPGSHSAMPGNATSSPTSSSEQPMNGSAAT